MNTSSTMLVTTMIQFASFIAVRTLSDHVREDFWINAVNCISDFVDRCEHPEKAAVACVEYLETIKQSFTAIQHTTQGPNT